MHPPQDEDSVVTCSDETRHNFQTGDYVTFSEVQVSTVDLFPCMYRRPMVMHHCYHGDAPCLRDRVGWVVTKATTKEESIVKGNFNYQITSRYYHALIALTW